jgi:hypothetical protein
MQLIAAARLDRSGSLGSRAPTLWHNGQACRQKLNDRSDSGLTSSSVVLSKPLIDGPPRQNHSYAFSELSILARRSRRYTHSILQPVSMRSPSSHWQPKSELSWAAGVRLGLALLICCTVCVSRAAASPLVCSPFVPAVEQNCWLYLDTSLPQSLLTTAANPFTSRYDCALALGYYLPCLVEAANRSYDAVYSALQRTPCLQGAGAASLVNHSAVLTVLQVDGLGQVGLLSDYKHGNNSLDGNVGCCDGSVTNSAAAAVSFTGAACCNIDQNLQPVTQQVLSTLQAGIHKSQYNLTAVNPPVPLNAVQQQRQQTGIQHSTATLSFNALFTSCSCNGAVMADPASPCALLAAQLPRPVLPPASCPPRFPSKSPATRPVCAHWPAQSTSCATSTRCIRCPS